MLLRLGTSSTAEQETSTSNEDQAMVFFIGENAESLHSTVVQEVYNEVQGHEDKMAEFKSQTRLLRTNMISSDDYFAYLSGSFSSESSLFIIWLVQNIVHLIPDSVQRSRMIEIAAQQSRSDILPTSTTMITDGREIADIEPIEDPAQARVLHQQVLDTVFAHFQEDQEKVEIFQLETKFFGKNEISCTEYVSYLIGALGIDSTQKIVLMMTPLLPVAEKRKELIQQMYQLVQKLTKGKQKKKRHKKKDRRRQESLSSSSKWDSLNGLDSTSVTTPPPEKKQQEKQSTTIHSNPVVVEKENHHKKRVTQLSGELQGAMVQSIRRRSARNILLDSSSAEPLDEEEEIIMPRPRPCSSSSSVRSNDEEESTFVPVKQQQSPIKKFSTDIQGLEIAQRSTTSRQRPSSKDSSEPESQAPHDFVEEPVQVPKHSPSSSSSSSHSPPLKSKVENPSPRRSHRKAYSVSMTHLDAASASEDKKRHRKASSSRSNKELGSASSRAPPRKSSSSGNSSTIGALEAESPHHSADRSVVAPLTGQDLAEKHEEEEVNPVLARLRKQGAVNFLGGPCV